MGSLLFAFPSLCSRAQQFWVDDYLLLIVVKDRKRPWGSNTARAHNISQYRIYRVRQICYIQDNWWTKSNLVAKLNSVNSVNYVSIFLLITKYKWSILNINQLYLFHLQQELKMFVISISIHLDCELSLE